MDERAVARSRRRMDDDARGLVDDEESVVLVCNPERDLFGLERLRDGRLELDVLAAREALALRR